MISTAIETGARRETAGAHTHTHTHTQSVCVARRTGDYRGKVANQAKDSRAVHTLTHGLTPNQKGFYTHTHTHT